MSSCAAKVNDDADVASVNNAVVPKVATNAATVPGATDVPKVNAATAGARAVSYTHLTLPPTPYV